jgi:hypothetical protein
VSGRDSPSESTARQAATPAIQSRSAELAAIWRAVESGALPARTDGEALRVTLADLRVGRAALGVAASKLLLALTRGAAPAGRIEGDDLVVPAPPSKRKGRDGRGL